MSLGTPRRSSHDGGGLMVQYIPRSKASLALALALLLGACTAKTDNNAAADSALNKDIQLANRDTAAQPALTDVPAATATTPAPTTSPPRTTTTRTPTTTTRRPTTSVTSSGNTVTRTGAGSAARVGTIPAGATLNLASGSKV